MIEMEAREEKKHRIIFVDDEQLILSSLRRTFRSEGYEIHLANGGEKALQTMKEIDKPFSLIVSDQRMPNMDGVSFLEKAKKICPNARRIMLSGYSDFNELMGAVNRGEIHRYLSKPCNDGELILTVRQELDQYELILENRRLLALTKKQNKKLYEISATLKNKVDEQTAEIKLKNHSLESSLKSTVELLLSMTGMLNPELCNYMQMTAQLSRNVGEQLGLDNETLEQLEIAGLTHDLGLIGMADRIIRQYPGNMSTKDFALFSQHPVVGQSSLLCIDALKKASNIVFQHHERNDGSGFPNGLIGDQISLEARILGAVSDYCWITKMWPMDQQSMIRKGKRCFGISLVDMEVQEANRNLVSHTIAKKALLMGANEKYDIDVVTTLIKIVKGMSDFGYEKTSLDKLEAGMVLAESIRHRRSHQLLLNRGVCLKKEVIDTIKKLAQNNLIDTTSIYIKKQMV